MKGREPSDPQLTAAGFSQGGRQGRCWGVRNLGYCAPGSSPNAATAKAVCFGTTLNLSGLLLLLPWNAGSLTVPRGGNEKSVSSDIEVGGTEPSWVEPWCVWSEVRLGAGHQGTNNV